MSDIPLFPPPTPPSEPKGSHLKGWLTFFGKVGGILGGFIGSKELRTAAEIAKQGGKIR